MDRIVSGLVVTLAGDASTATATVTLRGIFITRFETANRAGFLGRLDRQMRDYGFLRSGYTADNGAMVATATRMVAA